MCVGSLSTQWINGKATGSEGTKRVRKEYEEDKERRSERIYEEGGRVYAMSNKNFGVCVAAGK